jgi:hypothetical protein
MNTIKSLAVKSLLAVSLLAGTSAQAANLCNGVFNGTVERLRVQEQASGETVVRLYMYPGTNAEYAGYTTSDFMVKILAMAKKDQNEITGYTDDQCKIKWVDLK